MPRPAGPLFDNDVDAGDVGDELEDVLDRDVVDRRSDSAAPSRSGSGAAPSGAAARSLAHGVDLGGLRSPRCARGPAARDRRAVLACVFPGANSTTLRYSRMAFSMSPFALELARLVQVACAAFGMARSSAILYRADRGPPAGPSCSGPRPHPNRLPARSGLALPEVAARGTPRDGHGEQHGGNRPGHVSASSTHRHRS